MTTTTHIRPPRENGYMGDDAAVLGSPSPVFTDILFKE